MEYTMNNTQIPADQEQDQHYAPPVQHNEPLSATFKAENVEKILVMKQSEFYDAQQGTVNEAAREHSETIFVKRFNNFIKNMLITQFCRLSGPKLSVLDLCCGRGGDLHKWSQ